MSPLGDDIDIRAINIHRPARRQDRTCRLDRDANDELLSGGNAAKHATIIVADEFRSVVAGAHLVTGLTPIKRRQGESTANLDTLDRIDRHHCRRKIAVQLAIDGLAKPGRNTVGDNFENRAGGTAGLAHLIKIGFPFAGRHRIGAEERVVRCLVPVKPRTVDLVRADLHNTATDPVGRAKRSLQNLVGNRAGGYPDCRFTGRGPATTAIVANAVFLLIGEVSMAGSKLPCDVAVILGSLVLVADQHGYWRAGRHALENAGQDFNPVILAALRDKAALPRLAPVKIGLDQVFGQWHARRHAIDNAANAGAVAFTKAGEGKKGSETVVAHIRRPRYPARRQPSSRQRGSRNQRDASRRSRQTQGPTADRGRHRRHLQV